jgi:dihydropyrimidinase
MNSAASPVHYVVRGAELLGTNGRSKVDVVVQGEQIKQVGDAGTLSAPEKIDADGLWIMPGAVDAHVHPIHNETFASTGRAALFGGVTSILHHLYPKPGEDYAEAVRRAAGEASRAPADYGFHVRITPERVADTDYDQLSRLPVLSVKAFLAHSDPSVACGLGELYEVMREAARADLTIIVHAELGDVIRRSETPVEGPGALVEFDRQRPAELEAAAVHAVCAIAAMTECTLYLPHVSSAAALESAHRARRLGTRVFIETCPHYLLLTHDCPLGGLGKVAPPLRSDADASALRQAVADGMVDTIASDHCGYSQREKSPYQMTTSSYGLPGIELLLPLMLDAAIDGSWMSEDELVCKLSTMPARVFGLKRKGAIAPGYDADLVLIDPSGRREVKQAALHDRSFYSPYEGRMLRGEIVRVFRRGVTVVDHGRLSEQAGGSLLETSRANRSIR